MIFFLSNQHPATSFIIKTISLQKSMKAKKDHSDSGFISEDGESFGDHDRPVMDESSRLWRFTYNKLYELKI